MLRRCSCAGWLIKQSNERRSPISHRHTTQPKRATKLQKDHRCWWPDDQIQQTLATTINHKTTWRTKVQQKTSETNNNNVTRKNWKQPDLTENTKPRQSTTIRGATSTTTTWQVDCGPDRRRLSLCPGPWWTCHSLVMKSFSLYSIILIINSSLQRLLGLFPNIQTYNFTLLPRFW